MSDTEILLKAAINRIAARISEKLINSAQDFTEIAEEIPKRIQDEWSSFTKEVIEETERLERNATSSKENYSDQQLQKEDIIQSRIDNLRSKVNEINKNLEERN